MRPVKTAASRTIADIFVVQTQTVVGSPVRLREQIMRGLRWCRCLIKKCSDLKSDKEIAGERTKNLVLHISKVIIN